MNIRKVVLGALVVVFGIATRGAELDAVQLWDGGPYWATVNLGDSEVQDHPEYGAIYNFDAATNAVAALGDGWRLPTKADFEALTNNVNCTYNWDDDKKGGYFTSKSDPSKSVFFPAAGQVPAGGSGTRFGRKLMGYYWSSEVYDGNTAWNISIGSTVTVSSSVRNIGMSVRVVKYLPPVTIDAVKVFTPWDSTKGTIKIDYTLQRMDAKLYYKVAFDITVGGETRGVTNAAAKLTNGTTNIVIDTVKLFNKAVTATQMKVKVSLIAFKTKGADAPVQLWENGPYFATCNVGAKLPGDFGGLYAFEEGDEPLIESVKEAVESMGEG